MSRPGTGTESKRTGSVTGAKWKIFFFFFINNPNYTRRTYECYKDLSLSVSKYMIFIEDDIPKIVFDLQFVPNSIYNYVIILTYTH